VTRASALLLAAAALGCGEPRAPAQPPPVSPSSPSVGEAASPANAAVLDALRALLPELDALLADSERVPGSTPLAAAVARARKDVVWLRTRAASWSPGAPVDAFAAAFAAHRQVLSEARQAPPAEAAAPIEAVARDLSIKAQQCRAFGGPVPVNVRVVTRDAENREVSGYEVWYVRKAYERLPAAYRRFEQNSSPAGHVFDEAGYYVIWADHLAARARRQRGVPLDLEVGPDRREQVVDLIVPDTSAGSGPTP
jgi:hypothetical protein